MKKFFYNTILICIIVYYKYPTCFKKTLLNQKLHYWRFQFFYLLLTVINV